MQHRHSLAPSLSDSRALCVLVSHTKVHFSISDCCLPGIMKSPIEKSNSESDLTTHGAATPPNIYVTNRTKLIKRKREDDLAQFKNEMSAMITDLLSSQLSEIKKNTQMLNEIKTTNNGIEGALTFLSSQYEESRKKIEKLESQAAADKTYIITLEHKIMDLQRDNRKSSIEIKNVPIIEGETKDTLVNMVAHLGDAIRCPVTKSEIRDIYRIKNKKENQKCSTVIVESTSTILRNDILKMSKAYNLRSGTKLCAANLGMHVNEYVPIYVTEHLTPLAARLYFLARDLKKAKSFKYCWTSYGKVYLRKEDNSRVIEVLSEAQIERLAKET